MMENKFENCHFENCTFNFNEQQKSNKTAYYLTESLSAIGIIFLWAIETSCKVLAITSKYILVPTAKASWNYLLVPGTKLVIKQLSERRETPLLTPKKQLFIEDGKQV